MSSRSATPLDDVLGNRTRSAQEILGDTQWQQTLLEMLEQAVADAEPLPKGMMGDTWGMQVHNNLAAALRAQLN